MRGLDIQKKIPASVTKVMLGIHVDFISSHLTVDKLFPVNPRAITGPPNMSLLLEAESIPSLIIKPRLILVTHTDNLGWYITSNQQRQMLVQNHFVSQILYCTTDCIPVDWMFQENFPTNTQIFHHLSHRNNCRQRGVI